MQDDNTQYLLETYPCLYEGFGYFECEDGWLDLLVELSEKLEPIFAAHVPEVEGFPLQVGQVKAKFGGLRFYLESYTPMNDEETQRIEAAIEAAEARAWVTCEECGEPGELRKELPWIQVLCEEHLEETIRVHQEARERWRKRK